MPQPAQAQADLTFYSYHPQASDDLNVESVQHGVRAMQDLARASQNNLRQAVGKTATLPRNLPMMHPSHAAFVASIETTALKAALAALFEHSLASALRGLDEKPVTNAEQYLDETMAAVSQFGQMLKDELRAAAAAKRMSHFRPKPSSASVRVAASPPTTPPTAPGSVATRPLALAAAMPAHC